MTGSETLMLTKTKMRTITDNLTTASIVPVTEIADPDPYHYNPYHYNRDPCEPDLTHLS